MRYAAPLKAGAPRIAFFLLLLTAGGLILLGKADALLVERMRTAVADAFAPILAALGRPVATVDRAIADLGELVRIRDENQRLREENARLRQWEQVARELDA